MYHAEPPPDRHDAPGGLPGVAVAVLDVRGVVTGWSPAAGRLLGYGSHEVIGRRAADLLAADLPVGLRGAGRRDGWSGPIALRHRDGGVLDVEVHACRVHGGRSGACWVVIVADAAQADQPRRGSLLSVWALEQMPIPLGVFDLDGRMVACTEEGLRVNAMGDEVLGLPLREITPSASMGRIEQLMTRVLRTGERVTTEIFDQAQGESRPHASSLFIYPLRDLEGRTQGVAVGALDTNTAYWARRRLMVVNAASNQIGTTLDTVRTAQELADVATGRFADFTAVDLLGSTIGVDEPDASLGTEQAMLWRSGLQSVLDACPETAVTPGEATRYPKGSPMARALATRRASRHSIDEADFRAWLRTDTARRHIVDVYGMHSWIVVPLCARGTTLGLAAFIRHRTPEPFDDDDLLLAEEISAQAALAIDNARRYTREREVALALQRSLLPQRTPRRLAVSVASRYRPASSRAGVGGDWFDAISLSGARVALVVGDVVGHGLHASANMGRLRTVVRTLADIDMPPDELLTHLDDVVLRLNREEAPADDSGGGGPGAPGELAATCLYAVYDPIARRCCLARAGHPAPAIVPPDGQVYFPELPNGPPLGVGGLPFESVELDLPDGSLMALFTDGLIAADRDVDVGLARLADVLAGIAANSPLETVCDGVLHALLPVTPADDVALLVARTRGLDQAHVATWDLPADPSVVARARKAAVAQVIAWGLCDASFVTELVVSELVTNAIRHAQPPIRLRLIYDADLVCEVADGSSTSPHLHRARVYDEGGRGLMLVAQLTDRWGARHTSTGKTIWTEQAVAPANPGAA